MCKDKNAQDKAINELHERLRGEVINGIYRLFCYNFDGGSDDLVGLFAVTSGGVGNEFDVDTDGNIHYSDRGPVWNVTGIGKRGIAAICDADYALSM